MTWAIALIVVIFAAPSYLFSRTAEATLGTASNLVAGWTDVSGFLNPPPMAGAMMAYSAADHRFVLFGGWDGVRSLSETWVFDPTNRTWTLLHPINSPIERGDHMFVYDEKSDTFVLFGGWSEDSGGGYVRLSDTWTFSLQSANWTEKIPWMTPSPRSDGQVAYDPQTDTVFLFGGFDGSAYLGDSWSYSVVHNNWTPLHLAVEPSPRADGRMIYDVSQDRFILFGGNDYNGPGFTFHHLADTWSYDPTSNTWTQLPTPVAPSARDYPLLAADPNSGNLLLMSGYGNRTSLSDLWTFDLKNNTWLEISTTLSPPARFASTGGFDPVENFLVVFGGATNDGLLADTWYYRSPILDLHDPTAFPAMQIILGAGAIGVTGIVVGVAIAKRRLRGREKDLNINADHKE